MALSHKEPFPDPPITPILKKRKEKNSGLTIWKLLKLSKPLIFSHPNFPVYEMAIVSLSWDPIGQGMKSFISLLCFSLEF